MEKLLGILPYLYFYDEPIRLGSMTIFSIPDTQGRDFTPIEKTEKAYLQELIKCFPVYRGLASNKGTIRAFAYFLIDNPHKDDFQVYNEAKKTITLMRYLMLRPDSQSLNDFETSTIYTFNLPPIGDGESRTYHCWVNFAQEEWPTPAYQMYAPLGWHVDCQMEHTSILEDLDSVRQRFFTGVLEEALETNILLAMEWYNYSFLKYSPRGLEGKLTDISIAFDTLFRLQESKSTLYDCLNATLGVTKGTPLERWSRDFYGKVRSATMHFGKPATLIYKHPEATQGHVGFLWTAQKIFRECVAVKAGLSRQISNEHLIEELTPTEVILNRLRTLGSYEEIKNNGRQELWKLRQIYPFGERDNIVWLGKVLLSQFATEPSVKNLPNVASAIDIILSSDSNDENLWAKYVKLDSELNGILFKGDVEQARKLSQCITLAYDVSKFAHFAWFALQMLTFQKKRSGGEVH